MSKRKYILFGLTGLLALSLLAVYAHAEQIGSVDTTWNMVGANDSIVIEAFDDPAVSGVACHLSRAKTGGVGGSIGWAEDTSDASIACRQIGPITVDLASLKRQDGQQVFTQKTSILFKTMQVVRFVDLKRKTIIYLVYSTKLVDGSPKNAISSVPVMPWRE